MTDEASIIAVDVATAHDGEAILIAQVGHHGGGVSRFQVAGQEAIEVLRRAGVDRADDLIGCSWRVLMVRTLDGPAPLPAAGA